MIAYAIGDGIGWFRILGYGFHWKDTSKHRLSFSERNGYTKSHRLGKFFVTALTK